MFLNNALMWGNPNLNLIHKINPAFVSGDQFMEELCKHADLSKGSVYLYSSSGQEPRPADLIKRFIRILDGDDKRRER